MIREDPLYIGLRRPRASLEEATSFMDAFMEAASETFPEVVIQHEDFYSEAAFSFLERYQRKYRMFNDDIQGWVDHDAFFCERILIAVPALLSSLAFSLPPVVRVPSQDAPSRSTKLSSSEVVVPPSGE